MNSDFPIDLVKKLKGRADWFGVRFVREKILSKVARNGNVDSNQVSFDYGVMVEVMKNGHFGHAGTDNLEFSSIQNAYDRALELAELNSKWSVAKFSPEVRPQANGSYKSPFEMGLDSMTAGEVLDSLIGATNEIKVSPAIVSSVARAQIVETEFHYLCSRGSDVNQKFLLNDLSIHATAEKNGEFQSRSWGNGGRQVGLESLEKGNLFEQAKRIGEEAILLTEADECPTDCRDLLMTPDQVYIQIHESIGHPLEIDRIIGDERNYAGWSFVRPEDFGQLQYGSELLNVTFDPTVKSEYASYSFDDTGHQAKTEYIIEKGLLKRGLGSLESQERSGIPGVANARSASWNRAPIDRMANLNIEPGNSSYEDMISGVEKGILVKSNKSWSIDDYRNKFQFSCEWGQLIEDGRLTKIVKDPNYRGISTPFWKGLKKVGNRDTMETWGSPYCGKGEPNQVIRVGHRSPACLFGNVEIFGGAS